MKLRRLLLALFAMVVLFDLVLTLFVLKGGEFRGRPLPPYGALTNARQEAWLEQALAGEQTGMGRFDVELGWTYRPGSQDADRKTTINSIGARSTREYEPLPGEGITRILCFGDSYTLCDEIPDEQTWPAILERRVPTLEALNFGVGGYGTDQSLLRFRRKAPGLGGDVVLIGILLENIGRNVNRYRPLWYPRTGTAAVKPRFVLASGELELVPQPYRSRAELLSAVADGSVIETLAEHEYWRGRPTLPFAFSGLLRLGGGWLAYSQRQPRRLWLEPDAEPFELTLALLERFHREALSTGAQHVVVLVFPFKSDLAEYMQTGERYWQGLLDELDRRGVPHLDLAPALAEKHRACLDDPSLGQIHYGGHYSGVGNAVVAGEVATWLEAQLSAGSKR